MIMIATSPNPQITCNVSCRCGFNVDVNVPTLRDAQMIADRHERENTRRAYRHDADAAQVQSRCAR